MSGWSRAAASMASAPSLASATTSMAPSSSIAILMAARTSRRSSTSSTRAGRRSPPVGPTPGVSHSSRASMADGRHQLKPWAWSQLRRVRCSIWPTLSTPSATASSPMAWASPMTLAMMAVSESLCPRPATNERSILSWSTGNRRR